MKAQRQIVRAANSGECIMADFELLDLHTTTGEGEVASEALFELGMKYSVGIEVPVDLISAHMLFNLAAAKGNAEAARLRREIANQMSDSEVAAAQRAARDWLALKKRNTAATAIAA
jgi:uncharacterized protein